MILMNESSSARHSDVDLYASDEFSGDAGELVEMTANALTESHNLTIALARFEHKCIVENTMYGNGDNLMEGAVSEFFARAAKTIKEWWNKFVKWLGSMWTSVKDIFVKREDWLSRNKNAIEAKTDAELKSLTVKVGNVVAGMSANYISIVTGTIDDCKTAVSAAESADIRDSQSGASFLSKLKDKISRNRGEKAEFGKIFKEDMIGNDETTLTLSSTLVKKAVAKALETFKALDSLKGAKMVADAALKTAEGLARMDSGEHKMVAERVKLINGVSPSIQAAFAQLSSALNTANSQFMSICVKAASAKKIEVQNNSGDLLGAFM